MHKKYDKTEIYQNQTHGMKICLWKNVCDLISTYLWRLFSVIIADYALNSDWFTDGETKAGLKNQRGPIQRPKIRQTPKIGLFEEGDQGRGAWCLSARAINMKLLTKIIWTTLLLWLVVELLVNIAGKLEVILAKFPF